MKYSENIDTKGTAQTSNANTDAIKEGPLKPESNDPSATTVEFDKSGNINNVKQQMDTDKTGFADSKSTNTGAESRTIWNTSPPRRGGSSLGFFIMKR